MGPGEGTFLPLIHVLSMDWGGQGGHGGWRSKVNDDWATGPLNMKGVLAAWKEPLPCARGAVD